MIQIVANDSLTKLVPIRYTLLENDIIYQKVRWPPLQDYLQDGVAMCKSSSACTYKIIQMTMILSVLVQRAMVKELVLNWEFLVLSSNEVHEQQVVLCTWMHDSCEPGLTRQCQWRQLHSMNTLHNFAARYWLCDSTVLATTWYTIPLFFWFLFTHLGTCFAFNAYWHWYYTSNAL